MRRALFSLSSAFLLATACGGGDSETTTDASADATTDSGTQTDTSGDGDGTGGDGDGTTGDGDTGDGDGTTGDGDGDGTNIPPCPWTEVSGDPGVDLQLIATGFNRPLYVAGHPTAPDRLFVVEQSGGIKILEPGQTTAPSTDFLTISVNDGPNEMGLLGFAFHPDFPDDPRVYVNYNPSGDQSTIISEFTLDSTNPDIADPSSERILMQFDQPYSNHNGGMVTFGPDGMLYIGVGDGGAADDPLLAGQDLSTWLGKILRVDVDGTPYSVPSDNPFVGTAGAEPEIWAYGMRNPWRFSFDGTTMYCADVGQNAWEEVDVVEAGGNYGWSDMEGAHCFNDFGCDDSDSTPNSTNADGLIMPIYEYSHAVGASITGGYVYRSCEVPAWHGRYFFADYVDNQLFSLEWDGTNVSNAGLLMNAPAPVTSFGTNAWGDVFMTTFGAGGNGRVYRIGPA
jgi:glucose/arabinose dehydrogenase